MCHITSVSKFGILRAARLEKESLGKAKDVFARADDRRTIVDAKESTDGEGAAGRSGEYGEELARANASEQLVVERVVEEIVRRVALRWVVVHEHSLEAELRKEGGDAIGSSIGAREEDEGLTRRAGARSGESDRRYNLVSSCVLCDGA